MIDILTVLIFMAVPAMMIFLCVKVNALNKLGIVLLCYILGMVVGNLGVLPQSFSTPAVTNLTVTAKQDITEPLTVDILLPDGTVAETVTLIADYGYETTVKLPYTNENKEVIEYTLSDENAVFTSSPGDSTLSLL